MASKNHAKFECCEIAIVGGGCSGVLVATQLLRKGFSRRLRVVEPRPQLGRGLAYSTPFSNISSTSPPGR